MTLSDQTALHSPCRVHMLRLKPGEDLKVALQQFARTTRMNAAIILTCAGSLKQYNLRFANQKEGKTCTGHFEIVSLTGTLSATAAHLHVCLSDDTGATLGGHLLDYNFIYTTAEVAIAELTDLRFTRDHDPASGYPELIVSRK